MCCQHVVIVRGLHFHFLNGKFFWRAESFTFEGIQFVNFPFDGLCFWFQIQFLPKPRSQRFSHTFSLEILVLGFRFKYIINPELHGVRYGSKLITMRKNDSYGCYDSFGKKKNPNCPFSTEFSLYTFVKNQWVYLWALYYFPLAFLVSLPDSVNYFGIVVSIEIKKW